MDALFELAVQYHVDCETYDRKVCTGPVGRDGIMPATTGELVQINRNALAVRRGVREKAERMGFDPSELTRLISKHHIIEESNRRMSAAPVDSVEEANRD